MIWPVQLFHSTTGDEFSFAYMQHFHVSTALEKYRELTGGKTFELKTKTQEGTGFDMPINMFYKKVLAHFGCNDKLRGWYCENSQCPTDWAGDHPQSRGPRRSGSQQQRDGLNRKFGGGGESQGPARVWTGPDRTLSPEERRNKEAEVEAARRRVAQLQQRMDELQSRASAQL